MTPDMARELIAAWSGKLLAIEESGLARLMSDDDVVSVAGKRRAPLHGDIENGIGFLDIEGPLAARSSWWAESYEDILSETLRLSSEGAKGILLRLDTPGGEFSGGINLAQSLRAIGAETPIWTVADDFAASAGQLILAQGSQSFADRNGHVGSIGVIMTHFDMTGLLNKFGVKATIIRDGARKAEGGPFESLSDKAQARLQESVAQAKAAFVAEVVAGRGGKVTSEEIIDTESILVSAKEGLALGLVDGFATAAEAMEQMKSRFGTSNPSMGFVAGHTGAAIKATEEQPDITVKENNNMADTNAAAAANPAAVAEPTYQIVDPPAPSADSLKLRKMEADMARRDQIENACAIAGLSLAETSGIRRKRQAERG